MTNSPFSEKKYTTIETLVGTVINAGISFGLTFAAFGGSEFIERGALIADAAPQSFFVAFFAAFVPTLLTRKRLANGSIPSLGNRQFRLPANAFLRAIVFGVCALAIGVGGHALVLMGLAIESVSFDATLTYKTLYGAVLTWLVSPIALHVALRESNP